MTRMLAPQHFWLGHRNESTAVYLVENRDRWRCKCRVATLRHCAFSVCIHAALCCLAGHWHPRSGWLWQSLQRLGAECVCSLRFCRISRSQWITWVRFDTFFFYNFSRAKYFFLWSSKRAKCFHRVSFSFFLLEFSLIYYLNIINDTCIFFARMRRGGFSCEIIFLFFSFREFSFCFFCEYGKGLRSQRRRRRNN